MGISHGEASICVGLSIEKMFKFIRRYGHHYPVLFALKRGEPVDLSVIEGETIMSVDMEDKEPNHKPTHIYRSALGLRMQDEEDERSLQKVADEVARTCDPDAVALLNACLFAEYEDPDAKVPANLEDEPESYKVLQTSYWLREDGRAVFSMAPFQTEGQIEREDIDWASQDQNTVNCGLVTVVYPWTRETSKLKPRILDPYREIRK
jgi:hypothetical protein